MAALAHFACRFRAADTTRLFLWFSNEQDGVERSRTGQIVTFATRDDLDRYARSHNLDLSPEAVAEYDFDSALAWCANPVPEGLAHETMINLWNLLADASTASDSQTLFGHLDANSKVVYNKLFWGSNVPGVTPAGESFVPSWSAAELDRLASVFKHGIHNFMSQIDHDASELTGA